MKKKIMENECKLTFEFNALKRKLVLFCSCLFRKKQLNLFFSALLSEQKALLAQEREYSRFIAREERRKKEKRSKSAPRKKEEKKDIVDTVLHLSAGRNL